MPKRKSQSEIDPAAMKRIKDSIAANNKQQFKNAYEEALKFISLQNEASEPLRKLYQSAYAGKQALLKKYYSQSKQTAAANARKRKGSPVPLFRHPGDGHFPADPMDVDPTKVDRKHFMDATADKLGTYHPRFIDVEYLPSPFDFALIPDATTNGNATASVANHLIAGQARQDVSVVINAEDDGVAFGMLSAGSYFYRDDSGWTEADGFPGLSLGGYINTLTGDGTYWVIKRIRVDKIYPSVAHSVAFGIANVFASHHVGMNTVHQFTGAVHDRLTAGFDRKSGEQFIIWIDVIYLASIAGGGITRLNFTWDHSPGGIYAGSLISVSCY